VILIFFLRRSDYGTANKNEARKYLRTYGLAPPGVDSYENQMKRCRSISWQTVIVTRADNCAKGLGILEMKKTNIEKYQYLSVLRNTNVHLFYRLLSNNVKVCLNQRVGTPRSEV
jgi:malate dehydrogenase (oxaloacetate-decarboxylating)(NADP+)